MQVPKAFLVLCALALLCAEIRSQTGEQPQIPSTSDFARNVQLSQLLANAQTSLQRGDLLGATSLLGQALAIDNQNRPARKNLIQLLLWQGKLKEAEEQAQVAARLFPNEAETFFLRALVAFHQGQLTQTSTLAETCLKHGDRGPEVHKLLAMSEYLQGHLPKFETHIREAARLNPRDPDPHYHLGRYYFEDKRYKEALAAFQQAFQIQPDYYKAHYYAGLIYESQDQIQEAKQEMQAAIRVVDQLKIRYAWPYADLGRLMVNEGDDERGIGWLYRAVRNDPGSPYAHYHFAKALFRKGASFEVKQELLEAIKLDPGYGEAYYLLARYYQKTGETQLAQETFAKFEEVKKNPPPSPFGVRRW